MKEEDINTLRQQDKNLRDALRQEEAALPQMPADLNERLMQHIGEPETAVSKPHRLWFYSAIAVAASIILLFVFHHGQEQTPQEPLVAQQTIEQPTVSIPEQAEGEPVDDSSPAVSEPVEEPKSVEKPRHVKKQRKTVTMLVELIPTSESAPANVKTLPKSLIAKVKAYEQQSDPSRTTGLDDSAPLVARTTGIDDPDPFVAMATQVEDIRQRGQRLQQEIEARMKN